MAFDFNNDINADIEIFDVTKFFDNIINQINTKYLSIRNNPRFDKLAFATLKKTPHKQLYIDCYKSNWDRYKSEAFYDNFWNIILDDANYCKTAAFKYKLNPFLGSINLYFNNGTVSPFYSKDTTAHVFRDIIPIRLNIGKIKDAMNIMYGNSILLKSRNYTYNISVHTIPFKKQVIFTNKKEELIELKNWINAKLKSGDWFIKPKDWIYTFNMHSKSQKTFWDIIEDSLVYPFKKKTNGV